MYRLIGNTAQSRDNKHKMNKSDSCKDGASKSNDDDVCEVAGQLEKMSTVDNNKSVCANCGKDDSSNEINNICNKCKQVKYCNAACKKKHRHKHKKECDEHIRLATERAAKQHDEKLFKEPPSQYGDCPICFLRLPTLHTGFRYMTYAVGKLYAVDARMHLYTITKARKLAMKRRSVHFVELHLLLSKRNQTKGIRKGWKLEILLQYIISDVTIILGCVDIHKIIKRH